MPKLIDLCGKQFGRLRVDYRGSNDTRGKPQWCCTCSCGSSVVVSGCNLKTGNSESCGCLQKEVATEVRRLRPYEAGYRTFLRSATHPVNMTYGEFLEFTKILTCHYCSGKISWMRHYKGRTRQGYNLDRKNNKKGYTSKNCVVCCKRCNYGKSQFFTYAEWVKIGKLIRSWKK